MRMENWGIVTGNDPYTPPELRPKALQGEVYGHPNHADGTKVVTTFLVGVRDGLIVTSTGNEYELGEPHPDYEALYPGAKQRALAHCNQMEPTTK